MVKVAKVNIWDTFVGAVHWNESAGYSTFEFDTGFLKKNWDLSPIMMPLDEVRNGKKIFSFPSLNKETFWGLPGMLADSLPDKFGNRLIQAWLAKTGRDANSMNPVERLCYTGKRGMGALEYDPVINLYAETSSSIEIDELVSLAKQALDNQNNLKSNIHEKPGKGFMEIIRVGTSAGGARAKAIIAYDEKTGDIRSGQIDGLKNYEYWIIKFDGVSDKESGDPKGYGKIEYAYYLMANDCGIKMSQSKLLKENKRSHFMTRRFDRIGTKKLHMQTLCAIAHFDYNQPASYSYEQAFQTMRQIKVPYADAEQLYRRMVFNVIARNQDDHTKNISFIMEKNSEWRLAPAYDLIYAYDPANKWMHNHQMSVNGKRTEINRADLLSVAKKMNIKKPEDIIEDIRGVINKWEKYADTAEVNPTQIKTIETNLILKLK